MAAIEVDYLVIGAGATGMAFADTLVADSDATIAIVDRHDKPGGHWNDAYSFVHLQQPSSHYGANSHPLGSGAIDHTGLNQGMYQLASGHEVLHHYEVVMYETLLPSGQVQYLPLSTAQSDGTVTSLVSGKQSRVVAKKVVDAHYYQAKVPSVVKPSFFVDDAVRLTPPNNLPRIDSPVESFVVIGAGKTGIDACIWLLQHDVDPDQISWIIPRDFWIQDRANFQPGEEFLLRFVTSMADQLDAVVQAESVRHLFELLENYGELRRIDQTVEPTAYHCAVTSDGEFALLQKLEHRIVRLGHVQSVHPGLVRLERGDVPTHPDAVYVNCTSQGIYQRPKQKVFDGDRITLQWVRTCQPSFSASLIGHVESTIDGDDTKNHLCNPVIIPDIPTDWLRMVRTNAENHRRWEENRDISEWLSTIPTKSFVSDPESYSETRPEITVQLHRFRELVEPALAGVDRLLNEAPERQLTSASKYRSDCGPWGPLTCPGRDAVRRLVET